MRTTGRATAEVGAVPWARLRDFVPGDGDLREMVQLAGPVALVQLAMMAQGAIDTIMVGRVSPTDLAAVALGNVYYFGVSVFGMGVLFALDPLISQAVGASDEVGVARGVQRGLVMAGGLTLVATLLILPVGPALGWARQPADVVPVAVAYARGLIPGLFPFYAFIVLRQSLQAMGFVRPILITVIGGSLANIVLNWVLIFGHLGSPAMGAVGSAWGTSVSRWLMFATLAIAGWGLLRPAFVPARREAFALAPLLRLLHVGAPIGAQQFLEFGVFGAGGLLMGWMGTIAVASHQVALQLAALTFMVPVGVAQATSVLVGRAVGRGDPSGARRAGGAGVLAGVGFMSLTALLFLLAPEGLARLFSDDEPVVAVAAVLLPIAGVFQIFDGLQVVAGGALRGVADTRVPMLLSLCGFWMVGLPVSVFLAFGLDWGPVGIWWGLAAGIGVVAILLALRMWSHFGRELPRLIVEEEHPSR